MKYLGKIFILFLFILCGCSNPETDAELLEIDRQKLTENLDYGKIPSTDLPKLL